MRERAHSVSHSVISTAVAPGLGRDQLRPVSDSAGPNCFTSEH